MDTNVQEIRDNYNGVANSQWALRVYNAISMASSLGTRSRLKVKTNNSTNRGLRIESSNTVLMS